MALEADRSISAAQNSLYIIRLLVLMTAGGIFGGMCGRKINRRIDASVVDKLFVMLMIVIIGINIYNIYQFMH